jgi:4-amino-4-deoxy-L-arabinose transferase-like glycosyltransferase
MSKKKTKLVLSEQKLESEKLLLPGYLFYLLILIWLGFVTYNYLKVYPINLPLLSYFFQGEISIGKMFSNLGGYFLSLTFVVGLFLSASGFGKLFQKIFSLDYESPSQNIFAIGLGLVFIIYFTLFVGWCGLLYSGVILALLIVGLLLEIKFVLNKDKKPELMIKKEKIGFLLKILILVIGMVLVYVFIGALSPETFYDSLKYHLAVPQMWIFHHKIFAISNFEYSFYPVNIHLLYLLALMFGNEITAKLIHFGLGLLTVATIYFWSRRYFSRRMGWLATVIVFSVPFVSLVMVRAAIEMGLAFFETLAVISMLEFLFAGERKKHWLVLSALFCGTAIGGKYLSAYCLVSLGLILFIQMIKEKMSAGKIILTFVIFLGISLFLPSPYLIRNYLMTGIFTYPYSASLKKDVTAINKSGEVEFTDPAKPERTLKNFLTLPWNIALAKKTQEPLSGAVLLLLAPVPFFFRRIDKKIQLLTYYLLIYYFCWFMVRTYFRYIIPFIPVAGLTFAYFISETEINRYVQQIIFLVLILLVTSTLVQVINIELMTMNPWEVVSGKQSKFGYLSTQRPSYPNPYYQVIDWANKNLKPDAKILFVSECRGYYCKRNFLVQTIGDFNPLLIFLRQKCVNGDDLYQKLRENGVTHILVNVPEARRLASYDILDFSPQELKIFSEFWKKYVKEVYRDIADISLPERGIFSMKREVPQWWQQYSSNPGNYVYLYEIMSEEEAIKPHPVPENFFLTESIYPPARWEKLKSTAELLKM